MRLSSPVLKESIGDKSIEQIAAEYRAHQVEPIVDASVAVEIICPDRDLLY